MIPSNRWVAVSAIGSGVGGLGFLSVFAAHQLGKQNIGGPIWTGYGVAVVLAIPSYLGLAWALKQSNKTFYGVFVGGMFFRLSGFAVTAFVTYRLGRCPLAAVMLPFAFGLIISSFIEIYFIQKEARPQPK